MEPGLSVLIAVSLDANLIIDLHELRETHQSSFADYCRCAYLYMTVTLLLDGIQRADLIFANVPEDMQILLMIGRLQIFVHTLDDLFVRASLKRHALAFVIKAEVDPDRDLYTTSTCFQCRTNNRFGVEGRRLNEDALLRISESSKPRSILRDADVLMSRQPVRFPVDHGDREGVMCVMQSMRVEFVQHIVIFDLCPCFR